MRTTKLIAALAVSVMLALPGFGFPTRCPFVDESGLPCQGAVFPSGNNTPNGYTYECSFGHRWVETN